MGLAGSGKSTQGKLLVDEMDGVWLSPGQVLRDTQNPEIQETMRRGDLVSDGFVIPMMAEAIRQAEAAGKDIVLDGYPRTVEQAEWVAAHLAEKIEAVVRILVPKDELFARLAARGRADDATRDAIEERFKVVEQNIYTVCEILTSQNVPIKDVDGCGTVEEVHERIKQAITEAKNE